MKRFLFVSLALVGVMAATPSVHANPLAPGGSNTLSDTFTLSALGTLVDTWTASPSALSAPGGGVTQTIFGTYQEWVYRNTTTGYLSFLEQVNLAPSSDVVERITATTYKGFTTDVGYLTGISLPPTGNASANIPNNTGTGAVIDRSSVASGGGTVGFNFIGTAIPAAQSSVVLVIETNAKYYNRNGVLNVIDGTTSSNHTFAPTAVPEPSSLALAGIGALGLIGYGIRRRKGA